MSLKRYLAQMFSFQCRLLALLICCNYSVMNIYDLCCSAMKEIMWAVPVGSYIYRGRVIGGVKEPEC